MDNNEKFKQAVLAALSRPESTGADIIIISEDRFTALDREAKVIYHYKLSSYEIPMLYGKKVMKAYELGDDDLFVIGRRWRG